MMVRLNDSKEFKGLSLFSPRITNCKALATTRRGGSELVGGKDPNDFPDQSTISVLLDRDPLHQFRDVSMSNFSGCNGFGDPF